MTSGIIVEQYRSHRENLLTMDPIGRDLFSCYQYITSQFRVYVHWLIVETE